MPVHHLYTSALLFQGPEAILCSKCDMGMHYKCLKLGKKPAEGSWLCPGCKGEGEADQAESSTGTVDPDVKIKEEKPEIKEEREEADEPSSDAMRKKPAAKGKQIHIPCLNSSISIYYSCVLMLSVP